MVESDDVLPDWTTVVKLLYGSDDVLSNWTTVVKLFYRSDDVLPPEPLTQIVGYVK